MEDSENHHLSLRLFDEGIRSVLSRWSALQVGVKEEGGGPHSLRKLELLCSEIFTWFTRTKEPSEEICGLETILKDGLSSLSVVAEDGSIPEVAAKFIVMHAECWNGDFRSIERLRQSHPPRVVHTRVSQDDVRNGRDTRKRMLVNAEEDHSNSSTLPEAETETEDGWVRVSSKRKSKRNRHRQVDVRS